MRTILIADDHPLTLMGTANYVQKLGYQIIETCQNGIVALNSIQNVQPELALLDINMPGLSGLDVLEKVAATAPTRIVILTMHNEYSVYRYAKDLGVWGYLLKERAFEELEECLFSVSQGMHYVSPSLEQDIKKGFVGNEIDLLTNSERKILRFIAKGYSSKKIADSLYISEKTVTNHRANIVKKLNLTPENNTLTKWAFLHQDEL